MILERLRGERKRVVRFNARPATRLLTRIRNLRNHIGDYQVCESLTRCDHAYQSVKLETQRLLKISSEIHRYLPQLLDEATVLAYRGHGTVEDIESDASGDDQPCSEEEDTQDEQKKEFAHLNTTRLTDGGAPRPFLCPCSPCERSFKTRKGLRQHFQLRMFPRFTSIRESNGV